ncbi:MAG: Maf family nucleotide pyrophosphatase [Bacteroidia bacterium]|nr:Maf family nucleotide pyrophosphatase [Bacteroidia bacterium]
MKNWTLPFSLILGSGSPRRKQLLEGLGLEFVVRVKPTDESFPPQLQAQEIPLFLCEQKAMAFEARELGDSVLITSDTIVWVDNRVLNKPETEEEAIQMLEMLSGKMHEVYTGVCLRSAHKLEKFAVLTKVYFKQLSPDEIQYYVKNYKPLDKAGAYGAQEWMGYVAITKLEGSYFNVMGLPVMELWEKLKAF